MEEAASESRYWCHLCEQTVNPIIMEHHQLDIKCPFCQSGFVEQMSSDEAALPGSDRALSLWAPILLGMMGNPSRRRRGRRLRQEDDDVAEEDDQAERRRRRSSATILQLLQGIRAGLASETEDRVILLNQQTESVEGDYLMGPGLDLLLQHLAENDPNPNRHGTPPAHREAVEALPTVAVNETLQCSVCLDDFDPGSPAKQMPCNHKFHGDCILPWLELHSSCPVCRFQLPAEEAPDEDDNDGDGSSGRRFSFPWPFSGLFAQSNASGTDNNASGSA